VDEEVVGEDEVGDAGEVELVKASGLVAAVADESLVAAMRMIKYGQLDCARALTKASLLSGR
jgi:hypothetical protein